MSSPKAAESRGVTSRSKPAAPAKADPPESTKDQSAATDPPVDPNVVLAQLVSLTQSISNLVRQNAETGDGQSNDTPERQRVVFAYDFLGVVLGRRAPSLFKLSTVTVVRGFGTLTFTNLGNATAARVRAANNAFKNLENLRNGEPVTIDDVILNSQRIDSIVTFTALGGVPVAIGPCLDPVDSYVG